LSEVVNGWVALLYPLSIGILAVAQMIRGRIAKAAAKAAADHAEEVKQTLAENTAKTAAAADVATRAVAEVKEAILKTGTATSSKLDDIKTTGEAVHTLVNSEYGLALRTAALALEKVASFTKNPGDEEKARGARKLSEEHDENQRKLDTTGGTKG
jgi:hypothetical protein